jgi:hypothetical protein
VIDNRYAQDYLKQHGFYPGVLDGKWGPQSATGAKMALTAHGVAHSTWPASRIRIALDQLIFLHAGINPGAKIKVDGISGPVYQYALELWQNHLRDTYTPERLVAHQPTIWPRQRDIRAFYGEPGEHQVRLQSPYPLYLDWQLSTQVNSFLIHQKCHDSALRVMERVKLFYGVERIHELGIDQFGGCLNVRKMRGGQSLSMHSWGCAIDWDADRNGLRSTRNTAQLAKPDYEKFMDFWAEEGWVSLGRERNYDWMHVQAARL